MLRTNNDDRKLVNLGLLHNVLKQKMNSLIMKIGIAFYFYGIVTGNE